MLPGTASPRVRHAPAAGSSEGANAVWLASSYGLEPDPWQAGLLHDWLLVRDGRWASARCGTAVPRQNGKNGALEVRELYGMVALAERILHTAHEVKTARKAFARLLEFFDNPRSYPELAAMVREVRRTNGQEAIVLDNGGSVEFIARSRGSGRGFSVDVLVADEAQELTEDAWSALLPTISASNNPQAILTGTPPPPGAAGEVFLRMRAAGVEGTDPRLAWSEWSCPDDLDSFDPDDRSVWASVNPALGLRLRLDTVLDERAAMSPAAFARERLGWWEPADQRTSALPGWESLVEQGVPQGPAPVFAVAAAEDLSFSCVVVAWRRPDGIAQVQTAEQQSGTAWLASAVDTIRSRYSATPLVHTSLRGVVAGDEVGPTDYERACKALADAVEGRKLRHYGPSDPGLQVAYSHARWPTSGPRRLVGRGRADICQLQAAALAVNGLSSAPTSSDFYSL